MDLAGNRADIVVFNLDTVRATGHLNISTRQLTVLLVGDLSMRFPLS